MPKRVLDEEKVKRAFVDEQTAKVKRVLQKEHGIDCLLLLLIGKGRWGDANKFIRENNAVMSDNTFRNRMREFENVGLAESSLINGDRSKRQWTSTENGKKFAKRLLEVFMKA